MSTALDDLRFEVAFSTDPNTTTPAFVDLTSRARRDAGVTIRRGREDETGAVTNGTCTVTFDNDDGALTPGLATSPFYPNVKPQNRLRVTYRDAATATNLIGDPGQSLTTNDSADFEGGIGQWAAGGSVPPVLSSSSVRAQAGAKSMLITWGAGGSFPSAQLVQPVVVGRTVIHSVYVWVPVGHPAVQLVVAGTAYFGSPSTTNGAWERISVVHPTPTSGLAGLQIWPTTAPTAGQQAWVDSAMVDEGSVLRPFTVAHNISYRFDGYVDEWPNEWPTGGKTQSTVTVTAIDLQGRLGRRAGLDSVIAETYKLNTPTWYFPLGEAELSTSAGDRIGADGSITVQALGAGGGTLTFAAGTGPPTDGSGAPAFAPASTTNGLYLGGEVRPPAFSLALTLEAIFLSSTLVAQTVTRWADPYGTFIEIGLDATGKVQAIYNNSFSPSLNQVVTSATVFADGRTHHAAVALEDTGGGAMRLTLTADSAVRGTPATWTSSGFVPVVSLLTVGGNDSGKLFTGTISHVAGYNSALSLATLTQHHLASTTGFAGERSDQRIARIASWAGIPAGLQALDVGAAKIAHVESTGKSAWSYIQDVATTEAGVVFISTTGRLAFYNRGRSYATGTPSAVSVTADVIDPRTRIVQNLADVVNDATVERAGGATVRVTNPESVATNGVLSDQITILSATDAEAFDRAGWVIATRSVPISRLPELGLDALTDPSTSPLVRWLDIYSRVAVTGLPSQAPASAADLRVQGYTESISNDGWSLVTNTTPYLLVRPLTLDDPVYGLLDGSNSLVI